VPILASKPCDFGRKSADFGRKRGARMRHMCSIKGFSSIPTVLDYSANFLISGGRDACDFGRKTADFGPKDRPFRR
jgi:hypothetical protein